MNPQWFIVVSHSVSDHCDAHFVVEAVGEWEGDTGDRKFEAALQSEYTLIDEVNLPNWGNTAYKMTVWSRDTHHQREDNDTSMVKCSFCGNADEHSIKICSLCRVKGYCSKECAVEDTSSHKEELSLRMIFLKDSLDFSNPCHYYRCYRGHVLEEIAERKGRKELVQKAG